MEAQCILAARYAAGFPAETARRLEAVPPAEVAAFLATLTPEVAVSVINSMLPSKVAAAIGRMERDELSTILGRLSPARCVLVLRSVAKAQRTRMVTLLPEKLALRVERLLRPPEESAGVIAEPVPAVLSPGMSVGEAVRVVCDTAEPYAYVVDDDHRLVGVVHRLDLMASDDRALVGNLMSGEVIRLPLAAPQKAVRKHPAWRQLDALPVVDGAGVLVGMIRHKSLRRLGAAPPAEVTGGRPALTAFLELGELYWGSLAALVTAVACGTGPEAPAEVEHGS